MSPAAQSERRLIVAEVQAGVRLDAFLASELGIGRRAAARMAAEVRVQGRRAAKGHLLDAGDEVLVPHPLDPADAHGDAPSPEVLRESSDVLVLAKPPGLSSVAIAGRSGPSAAGWLSAHRPDCAAIGRPGEAGLVHRLDAGTSGLLLAARTKEAYEALREQFRRGEIEKTYLAVVEGEVDRPLELDAAIGQHRKSRTRVRALSGGAAGRYAVTPARSLVRPVRAAGGDTLVEVRTTTGARHQVRVHLAHSGHPLVADERYGGRRVPGIDGYLLHASEITWRDPGSGERVTDRCTLPRFWNDALSLLEVGGLQPRAVPP